MKQKYITTEQNSVKSVFACDIFRLVVQRCILHYGIRSDREIEDLDSTGRVLSQSAGLNMCKQRTTNTKCLWFSGIKKTMRDGNEKKDSY